MRVLRNQVVARNNENQKSYLLNPYLNGSLLENTPTLLRAKPPADLRELVEQQELSRRREVFRGPVVQIRMGCATVYRQYQVRPQIYEAILVTSGQLNRILCGRRTWHTITNRSGFAVLFNTRPLIDKSLALCPLRGIRS